MLELQKPCKNLKWSGFSIKVIGLEDIKTKLSAIDVLPLIEEGFVKYSQGQAVVPPVGELLIDDVDGEVHIKYGYIKQDDIYVIKIASGFYQNASLGLPAGNGLMLVFNQKTGEPLALLQDEAYLTDVRTAVAGAIAAKYLAPKVVNCIGIVGTGIQARLQLQYLQTVTECKKVMVWGRNAKAAEQFQEEMTAKGYNISVVADTKDIMQACQIIVTTTPSKTALLQEDALQAGTHITAIGSDTPDKQEVDAQILAKADVVVADSISQCQTRGEISQALRQGVITENDILELGNIISGVSVGRINDEQITVADLTGVAVQDIQVAKAVYLA